MAVFAPPAPLAANIELTSMSRWKAFSLHLLLSVVLISGIALAALLTWYPHGLYRISGLDRLMVVMMCIDIAAGPLLTLLVYRKGKASLRFDLAVIALVQAAFLAYGLHTLWQSRPVFLVASDIRMNLVFASEISDEELARASRAEWRRLSWTGPQLVGVLPPTDRRQRQTLLGALMNSGREHVQLPAHYVPFQTVQPLMLRSSLPYGEPDASGIAPYRSIPVSSRFGDAWMLVHPSTGEPRKVLLHRVEPDSNLGT